MTSEGAMEVNLSPVSIATLHHTTAVLGSEPWSAASEVPLGTVVRLRDAALGLRG
jgi:hypothetical protein